jgi:signal transduction histidine kinase/predicted negative regulator of RcsB-dependent stress response
LSNPTKSSLEVIDQVNAILDKAYALRGSLIQTSLLLTAEALEISRTLGHKPSIARSLSISSLCLMVTGEHKRSMEAAEEAINLYEEVGDEKGVADAKYNIAGIYYKTDNPNIGLVFLKECLTTYQKFNDHHNMARVYKSMGTIYEYFEDEKSAIAAYEQSIEAGIAAGDPNLESNAYNPLSGIYLNNDQVDQAMSLIEKSISMKQQTSDIRGLGFALYGRGKIYAKIGETEKAETDYLEALKIHEKAKDPLGIGMVYNKLAELFINSGRTDKAKDIIESNLLMSKNGSNIKLLSFRSYYFLYLIAKQEGDYKSALEYLEHHHKEKETVINSRTRKVIESYETIHRLEGLEHEAIVQREKAEIIQKKNLELDSFFYRATHDLRSPLNNLKRIEFLLREEADHKNEQGLLNDIDEEIKSIEQILNELVKVTRVNHLSDIKEEIDFEKLISDCISSYKYLVNYDKVKITYNIEEGIVLKAEWALINAILQNLIENSIKNADINKVVPSVQIRLFDSDKGIALTVKDNGIGMSEEQKDRINDLFFRPNKQIKQVGMGLFIVYRAVESLKAKVEFDSSLNEGTSFTIYLPR